MITRDERSRDWLLSLNFKEFKLFNVLVYTTEELWYERAAVWLPGHSRYRNIDPLTKLKLQNKRLEGVIIGKWKFVKKIVNEKGTRIYVDMPPSSARALEKYKMQLSYELQKVNVFLKAIAIDKQAFDAGLNCRSINFRPTPNLTPMPCIAGNDKDIVRIAFKGNKPLSLVLARKVRDTIIYKMYKYHELEGKSRTDFVKYGFSQPGYFCLLPENPESRKWICDLDLGKINRIPLIIVGQDEVKNKYFNMSVFLPVEMQTKHSFERLKHSNQGVKGINFSLWKNQRVDKDEKRKLTVFNVDMDLESVETIIKMKYKLDYVIENRDYIALVESNLPRSKLEESIAKYKSELSDKYDVANMDIASDSDEEIVFLD
ncbi:jg6803 [Pararge aegeria aegeria]|uniref:Jg6803 protein n=3 Tax=Pararge aegeria TaxID=116150 RepID=A0A8S4RQ66_9NEOP|nr:jg6803 [Pararge aegeria aegeria]